MLKIDCEQFDFSRLADAFGCEIAGNCPLSAEIILADEEEIRRCNREMRGIDSVTDVLSFPSLDGIRGVVLEKSDYPYDVDENGNLFLGSIAICVKRAEEQAEEFGHSYARELHYLATHGLWHLLGYDHMTESDKSAMREREEAVLSRLNLTREEQ